MRIKKNSGELITFEPKALKRSLTKSGAKKEEVEEVFDHVLSELYDGIPSKDLYKLAFDYLKKYRSSYAARYSLKRALKDLGPEGYFFEKWIGKVLETFGYEFQNSKIVQGNAVKHEIDVVAIKDDRLIFCECKFRNDEDAKISVTTPMYFLSRIKDVEDNTYRFFGKDFKLSKGYLVTNAYLTSDSIDFANYYNLGLVSWNYPENYNLKDLVDSAALYPITCLTTLTLDQEKTLLEKGCILVKDLIDKPSFLNELNVEKDLISEILEEANELVEVEKVDEAFFN